MRVLNFKRKNHICSMKGCGNRITTMFCKSEDPTGCHYFCNDCVRDMYEAIYGKPVEVTATDKPKTSESKDADIPIKKEVCK